MGTNNKINVKILLDQMLSGNISAAEKDDLRNYIESSFKDEELDTLMREHWTGLGNREIPADEIQMLKLKNKILAKVTPSFNNSKKEPRLLFSNWANMLMRVAAILFIPLLLGSVTLFYTLDKRFDQLSGDGLMQQVMASPGSRVHFILPDKTEVWLNSESSLEFPLNLNFQNQRIVKLSGQGYFKVAPDKDRPFLVETQGIHVKALGTSFDVSGYIDDAQISSTLEEGSIALIGSNGKEFARLVPGQQAVWDKSNQGLLIKNVETILSTSWKDGKLIFRNTSLTDVATHLERWFNCEIHIDPALMKTELLYTATIQDETLGEVLKMIEISTSVKTKIEKREVYIGNRK